MVGAGKKFRSTLHSKQDALHIFSGPTPELQERRQITDLVVQNLRSGIRVLRVPVHARDAAFISGPVNRFDQGTTGAATASERVDEQIFQVAIAGRRSGGEMKVIMDEADHPVFVVERRYTVQF